MEPVAIFAALQWECHPVLRQLRRVSRLRCDQFTVWRGHAPHREVWLVKTGVGTRRAAAAAEQLWSHAGPMPSVSAGCAGGLAADLAPGDVALATMLLDAAAAPGFATDAGLRERMEQTARHAGLRVTVGPVLTSNEVLATVAAKRAAAAAGAVAVEMEGAAIAAQAAARGVPFASVRVILDAATMALPAAGELVEPRSGRVRPFAVAGYLARHPGALPALLALQRLQQTAQRSLHRFFHAWLTLPS